MIEIQQQTGITAPELKTLPELPAETAHIWRWFGDLGSARSAGFQINAISWLDAWAYFSLIGIKPQRWEIEALRALDDAFLMSRIDGVAGKAAGAKALKNQLTGQAAK